MTTLTNAPAFKRGLHVEVYQPYLGDWSERATLTGHRMSVSPTSGTWWTVRFDGDKAGSIMIHETQLRAA
jgi:hypothetical protein